MSVAAPALRLAGLDASGARAAVPRWDPVSDEDRALERHARDLVRLRRTVDVLPG